MRKGIRFGGENEQRARGLAKKILTPLSIAYFQVPGMSPWELFTELKYLFLVQKSMFRDREDV